MATMHDTEAREVIHHTAMQLAALEFIDPHAAKDLSEMGNLVRCQRRLKTDPLSSESSE